MDNSQALEVGKRLFNHNKLRILEVSPDDPSESIKDSMINIIKPMFSQIEGILLDPVYTSKVGAAFIDYCRKGMFNTEDHVLFWHTGGLMTLFV